MQPTTIEARPGLQPPLSLLAVRPRWTPYDRSSRRTRPASWPAPDPNQSLANHAVCHHLDLVGLSDDELLDELNMAKTISWRERPPIAGRRWLAGRVATIRSEMENRGLRMGGLR